MPRLERRQPPNRRGHRIRILEHAIAPLAPDLPPALRDRLHHALSVVYGIEPYIILKDIWGLPNREIDALSRSERLTCSEQVVPRLDLAAALQTLEHFVADPTRAQLFRQRQFARYVQALEPARPLRHWL